MKFNIVRLKGLTTVDLPFKNVNPNSPYILKAADGLGPPEIDVMMAKTTDLGGYYKGRQAQYREPVLRILLNPDYQQNKTVSDLRAELYGLLTSDNSDQVQIILVDDVTEVMYVYGFVKKFEIVPFNPDPEVQITLACSDAYFVGINDIHSDVTPGTTFQILNQGTADAGFYIRLRLTRNLPWFSLTDARNNAFKIDYRFETDDILSIDTRSGSRAVQVIRNGVTTSLLYAITMDSKWLYLYGGLNTLQASSASFVSEDFYYTPRYWGI